MEIYVNWSKCQDHMWMRHRIMMDWAKEAWDDLNRVVIDPDPASQSGDSIRVIGRSPTNDCIYTVIAVYVDGELVIATAWKSNSTQVQIYNNNLHLDGKQ